MNPLMEALMKLPCLLLSFALLSGCGSVDSRLSPASLADNVPNASIGVALLSAGAPDKCMTTATALKVMEGGKVYTDGELSLVSVDSIYLNSDFQDFHGAVHALALPPGRYYLAPWIANPYALPSRLPRYDFEVRAGEVTYLGSYFMTEHCGGSGAGEFSDRWDRDGALIQAKKASLNLASARKQILVATGLAVGRE